MRTGPLLISSRWQWASTPPGVTARPWASTSRMPPARPAPSCMMRLSFTPMSRCISSAAVITRALRTTRSKAAAAGGAHRCSSFLDRGRDGCSVHTPANSAWPYRCMRHGRRQIVCQLAQHPPQNKQYVHTKAQMNKPMLAPDLRTGLPTRRFLRPVAAKQWDARVPLVQPPHIRHNVFSTLPSTALHQGAAQPAHQCLRLLRCPMAYRSMHARSPRTRDDGALICPI